MSAREQAPNRILDRSALLANQLHGAKEEFLVVADVDAAAVLCAVALSQTRQFPW